MMIAPWMLHSFQIALLVTAAALVLEMWLRSAGRPVRWVWAAAPVVSLVLPLLALLTGGRFPSLLVPFAGEQEPWTGLLRFVESAGGTGAAEVAAGPGPVLLGDGALATIWVAATLLAAFWYAGVWRRVARSSGSWRRARVGGRSVLVSRNGGPAALGLFRPSIVVPEWLLGASEVTQRMVLLHEAEHVRSRDHALLALSPLLVILFPWNLPLWWQARRLRLAVELDCDRRVLARGIDVEAYASLLLQIAARPRGHVLAAPLAGPERRPLEARLRAMTRGPLRWPRFRAAGSVAAAVLFLALACEAEPPLTPGAARPITGPPLNSLLMGVTGFITDLAAEMASGRVQVFIDGERVDHDAVIALPAGEIGSIEVRKGALSEAAGDRLISGAINIRTRGEGAQRIDEPGAESRSVTGRSTHMLEALETGPAGRLRRLMESDDPLESLPAEADWLLDGRPSSKAEVGELGRGELARVEVVREKRTGAAVTHQVRAFTRGGDSD